MINVIKNREGEIINFEKEKIIAAITKATKAVEKNIPEELETKIFENIINFLENKIKGREDEEVLHVNDIQNAVEEALINANLPKIAKEYIIYRKEKDELRMKEIDIVGAKIKNRTLKVTKTNGTKEDYCEKKVIETFRRVQHGLKVSEPDFIKEISKYLVDGIQTKDLFKMMVKSAVDLITIQNVDYQILAGRLNILDLYKQVSINRNLNTGDIYNPENFLSLVKDYVEKGLYYKNFLNPSEGGYTEEEILELGNTIIQKTDFDYTYGSTMMMRKRYLLNPNKKEFELPQEMYLASAMFLSIPEKENKVEFAKKLYLMTSQQKISLPTPTILNARTNYHQLSSCFELNLGDDLRSIYHGAENMAQISKFGGGIGVYLGNIRSKGGYIRGVKGAAGGVSPWIKVFNDTAVAVNQLGCVEKESFVKILSEISFNHEKYGKMSINIMNRKPIQHIHKNRDNKNIKDFINNLNIVHLNIDNETIKKILIEYSNGENRENLAMKYKIPVCTIRRIITKLNKVKDFPNKYKRIGMFNGVDLNNYAINKKGDIITLNKGLQSLYQLKTFKGYINAAIGNKKYALHRLVYNTFKGKISSKEHIDHIDNKKYNNHPNNLRILHYIDNIKKKQEDLDELELEKISCNIRIKAFLNQGKKLNGHRTKGKEITNLNYVYKTIKIENIYKGDYVCSFNGENKEVIPNLVKRSYPVIVTKDNHIRIHYEDNNFITTSLRHPLGIFEEGEFKYRKSEDLKVGDISISQDGKKRKIIKIDKNIEVNENFRDLEVNNVNNYFCSSVNKTGLFYLTHNSRAGAISVTLDVFHRDIYHFLELQTETGDIRAKAFDVFPAVSFPDLFMERVKNNEDWSLFDPKEIEDITGKRLQDYFGEEFNKFYKECENDPRLNLRETVSAKDLYKTFLKSVVETGMPYSFYRDTVNTTNPNKHAGNIYCSNLCVEIQQNNSPTDFIEETIEDGTIRIEYKPGDTVVCNLASINIAKVNTEEEIKKVVPIAMKTLDNVIDLNYYPIKEAKLGAEKYRAVGLGFLGLAEYLAVNKIAYDSENGIKETKKLFEMYSYEAIKSSMETAKKLGSYPEFEGSEWSKGILLGHDKDWFINNTSNYKNWLELIENVKEFGLRNGYSLAIRPNTSTGILVGTTASVLPIYKKYFVETNAIAPTVNVAPGLNDENFWFYKEYVNMDLQKVIDLMAEAIYPFIDQSISFEFLINPERTSPLDLYNLFMSAHEKKIKTVYYVRSMSMEVKECTSCSG